MTIKLIALYRRPNDEAAFLAHYNEVHAPIVRAVPGLQRMVVNRVVADPMGRPSDWYMIAEMHYPDRQSFDVAMRSPENRAAGRDLMQFAEGLFELLVVEEQ